MTGALRQKHTTWDYILLSKSNVSKKKKFFVKYMGLSSFKQIEKNLRDRGPVNDLNTVSFHFFVMNNSISNLQSWTACRLVDVAINRKKK